MVLDPANPEIVYAGSYARGVWRSNDGGATWTQIKASLNAAVAVTRPAIAVTTLPGGATRMYVYEGNTGSPYARLFRSDSVATGAPAFTDLTSNSLANPGVASFDLCTGQCWYDLFVHTPAGHPDIVYVGGSYAYGENWSNKRGVILSTDAGVSGTDMTMDATDIYHPNGLHPDQHALVTNPNNPYQFFEANDGGVMRSSGAFADVSAWCDDPNRGITSAIRLARCKQVLSRVPTKLESLNKGLPTLQFQSLSVSPFNANLLQGGTQDNGTWQTPGNPVKWENTMIGDGGQSGFDAEVPSFRFHTFYDASPDVNFSNGDIADWNWISDPIFGTGAQFYAPIISDPVVSRTMFVGTANVWRTLTWGMGTMTIAELRQHCNEWFGDFAVQCGDWEQIASPSLSAAALGDRAGGSVVAVERTSADTSTSLGGDADRARLHLEERQRAIRGRRHLDASRLAGLERSQPLRHRDRDRSGEPEPGLDLLQRLRPRDADDPGSRVRGDLQSGDEHRHLGRSQLRPRRPAHHRRRSRRRHRRPLRVE